MQYTFEKAKFILELPESDIFKKVRNYGILNNLFYKKNARIYGKQRVLKFPHFDFALITLQANEKSTIYVASPGDEVNAD